MHAVARPHAIIILLTVAQSPCERVRWILFLKMADLFAR